MTVDDVITQVLREQGLTEEQLAGLERKGGLDPHAAAAGKLEVTPMEAEAIRRDMAILTQMPREALFGLLHAFEAKARADSVMN